MILCRIDGFNFPLLIDHIRREAEYFITVLFKLNEGIDEPIEARIVRQQPSPPCVPLVGGDPQPVASARKPSPAVIESRLDPPWGNYVKIID